MAHPYWPLFDLRIRTPRLELRLPADDEISDLIQSAKSGVHDSAVMPFANPWTDLESPELERGTARWHWRGRAEWSPDRWRLGLAIFLDGYPIGAQDLIATDFAKLRKVSSGSWLASKHQGHGYGKEMRAGVLYLAFEGLGAEIAESEAWEDNAASIGVSESLGYVRNGIGRRPHPRGEGFVTSIRFRMTLEQWREKPRPPIQIEGLDGCRDMFGQTGSDSGPPN